MPISTLSRRIRALEKRVGVRLLLLKGHLLKPTTLGEVLYERVAGSFANVDQNFSSFINAQNQLSGQLRVMTHRLFYEEVLQKTIQHFLEAHPLVKIDITCNQMIDSPSLDSNTDLLVTCDLQDLQNSVALPIDSTKMGFFATAAFLETYGAPKEPNDLSALPWVANYRWHQLQLVRDGKPVGTVPIDVRYVINDLYKVGELIESGVYAGALPLRMRRLFPKLVRFMPEIELNINTLYVVYRERALQPVLLKAFVEAIQADTKAFHAKMNDWQFDFENQPPAAD